MKEINIQEIIDTNYRVLALLGYALSITQEYKRYCEANDNLDGYKECEWFFNAFKKVIYMN